MKTNHLIRTCLTFILLVSAGCSDGNSPVEEVATDTVDDREDTDATKDTGTESNGDTEKEIPADTDSDIETNTEQGEPQTAYFLVDSAGLGGNGVGCDLNNDGQIDNNLGGMVNDFIKLGILKGDPSDEIQESIDSGAVLIAFKMSDANSFQNDSQIVFEEYIATIDDFDPQTDDPPTDLFSGHGTVSVADVADSLFGQSKIEDWWVQTSDSPMVVPISIAGAVVNVELATGRIQAHIEEAPDDDMLGGNLGSGTICGGIEKQYLIDLLIEKAELKDALSQSIARKAVNGRVDMKCGDTDCISVGVVFTAVSVGIE